MAEKVTNNAPCPTCGRTVGFRPVSEFLAEVREHNAALTTARAEAEGLRGLLRECQSSFGDVVMGHGLHPDDAITLHAKISAALTGTRND